MQFRRQAYGISYSKHPGCRRGTDRNPIGSSQAGTTTPECTADAAGGDRGNFDFGNATFSGAAGNAYTRSTAQPHNQAPVCAIRNLGELRNPHGSDCWVRYGSNNSGQNGGINDDKGKDCNYLGSGDYSPEKAGVGGSTPSLATTFLST